MTSYSSGWCRTCQGAYYRERRQQARLEGMCADHRLPLLPGKKRHCDRCRAVWRTNALKKFGLTEPAYAALLEGQGGGCAVCGVRRDFDGRNLAVDHDHATGKGRGILCAHCNTAIGKARDSSELLRRMAAYLEERG